MSAFLQLLSHEVRHTKLYSFSYNSPSNIRKELVQHYSAVRRAQPLWTVLTTTPCNTKHHTIVTPSQHQAMDRRVLHSQVRTHKTVPQHTLTTVPRFKNCHCGLQLGLKWIRWCQSGRPGCSIMTKPTVRIFWPTKNLVMWPQRNKALRYIIPSPTTSAHHGNTISPSPNKHLLSTTRPLDPGEIVMTTLDSITAPPRAYSWWEIWTDPPAIQTKVINT